MSGGGGLALIENLREQLQSLEGPLTPKTIIDELQTIEQKLLAGERNASYLKARAVIEKDQLRAEMHCELVDREANAARVAERQRFLFERSMAQPGQASAAERASASALYVEAALVALCPHSTPRSPGCDQLAGWPGNG